MEEINPEIAWSADRSVEEGVEDIRETTIPLRFDDIPELTNIQKAIDMQQVVLDNLRYALEMRVRAKYGVDTDKEDWILDLDQGALKRTDDNTE